MIFILDAYDSYVYNLVAYIQALGESIEIRQPHRITIEQLERLEPDGIVLSPGPGHPGEYPLTEAILKTFYKKIPILGVCLGHQAIGHFFQCEIIRGKTPMHGKLTKIHHCQQGIFRGLPKEYFVTRYHSLIIDRISPDLRVTAVAEEGVIMGIEHRNYPVYGVQFHPEALQTEYGSELLNNFIGQCRNDKSNRRINRYHRF